MVAGGECNAVMSDTASNIQAPLNNVFSWNKLRSLNVVIVRIKCLGTSLSYAKRMINMAKRASQRCLSCAEKERHRRQMKRTGDDSHYQRMSLDTCIQISSIAPFFFNKFNYNFVQSL